MLSIAESQDLRVSNALIKVFKQNGRWQHAEHMLFHMPAVPDASSLLDESGIVLSHFAFRVALQREL